MTPPKRCWTIRRSWGNPLAFPTGEGAERSEADEVKAALAARDAPLPFPLRGGAKHGLVVNRCPVDIESQTVTEPAGERRATAVADEEHLPRILPAVPSSVSPAARQLPPSGEAKALSSSFSAVLYRCSFPSPRGRTFYLSTSIPASSAIRSKYLRFSSMHRNASFCHASCSVSTTLTPVSAQTAKMGL